MSDLAALTPERIEDHADWLTAEAQGYDDIADDDNEREATRRHAAEDASDCREVAAVLRAVAALRRAKAELWAIKLAELGCPNPMYSFERPGAARANYNTALRVVEGP